MFEPNQHIKQDNKLAKIEGGVREVRARVCLLLPGAKQYRTQAYHSTRTVKAPIPMPKIREDSEDAWRSMRRGLRKSSSPESASTAKLYR